MSTERLIPPTLLYRFAVACRPYTGKWNPPSGIDLGEEYRLPLFSRLDGREPFADFRIAWSPAGLFVQLEVADRQQPPWCRAGQVLDSDGLHLWIDTRDTHNVHRATRFCHWFVLLPGGAGSRSQEPLATMLKINRARDVPRTFGQSGLPVVAAVNADSYRLAAHIPAAALDGWNHLEHRQLGFNYTVFDRERGYQTLATGPDFPIAEDPSLWHTLELADAE